MEQGDANLLQQRMKRQGRSLRILAAAYSVLLLAFLATSRDTVLADKKPNILRTQGIVIVDEKGRERILLGAPIPTVPGRRRQDPTTGIVVLGENGADRVSVGFQPDPQVLGKVRKRISPGAGITIHDLEGNERGGFSVMDNGRVALGLDYATREAVSLFVMPEEGYAGMMVAGEQGKGWERGGLIVNNKTGKVVFKLADPDSQERVMLDVNGSVSRFLVIDPQSKREVDLLERVKQ